MKHFFTGFISKILIKTTKGQQIMNKQIEILKKFNLREDVRAENLSLEDFAKLADNFVNNL